MITIAFKKSIDGIYVSHTDIIRCLNRTFRRAGINVAYSKGFNRHMSLKLTQPLPFGIASNEEWVTADILDKIPETEILERFNKSCPPFLNAYFACEVTGNPNLGGLVVASDYFIENDEAIKYKNEIEKIKDYFEIETKKKKEVIIKEISNDIIKLEITKKGIYFMLPFGNKNVRIDDVGRQLAKSFNLDIDNTKMVRLHQYVKIDNEYVLVSDFIKTMKK